MASRSWVLLSALIVGPCVAPPLAAAVLYISQTHDPVFGGLALFVLSLGMGAPLVVFGTAAGKLLPRAGAWMDAVKAVFGVLFLGLSIWMLARVLDAFWIMLMTGALADRVGGLSRRARTPARWRIGLAPLVESARHRAAGRRRRGDRRRRGRWTRRHATAGRHRRGRRQESSDANTLTFGTIKSVDDLDRALAAAKAGAPAGDARLLRGLVRQLQGNGEVHVLARRRAEIARRFRAAEGRRHRERRCRSGAAQALRIVRPARDDFLRRRRRAPRAAADRLRESRRLHRALPARRAADDVEPHECADRARRDHRRDRRFPRRRLAASPCRRRRMRTRTRSRSATRRHRCSGPISTASRARSPSGAANSCW